MNKALEILKQVKELSGWIKCGAELPFDEELDEAIAELEEAMKPKTCQECKWWDRTRPRSHPNYAECNNRNCPISYEEVIYTFGCNMYEPKEK